MLDAKAYKAHFPDDPAYELPPGVPRQLNSAALMEALAALEAEFRDILRQSTSESRSGRDAFFPRIFGAKLRKNRANAASKQTRPRLGSRPLWRQDPS